MFISICNGCPARLQKMFFKSPDWDKTAISYNKYNMDTDMNRL